MRPGHSHDHATPVPPRAVIDRSPTLLLAGLFAARRSGDAPLERVYLRRLHALGIAVTFGSITPRDSSVTSVLHEEFVVSGTDAPRSAETGDKQ